jgi:hypothetical protein
METVIRPVVNTPDEIFAGHKLWFVPVHGCDAISATANAPGFTPLIAIARYFGWDYDLMRKAADDCNHKRRVAVLKQVTPTLLLVPATKGRGEDAHNLALDLLSAVDATESKSLHITHFGFLQGRFPKTDVAAVLDFFFRYGSRLPLERLVIDIDVRSEQSLYDLMRPPASSG